jgi:glycosyltransferase involved in cell wall biosynthesis
VSILPIGGRRLRITAVAHAYIPAQNAGAEVMLHNLLRPLAERGHDVRVLLTTPAPDEYLVDGVRVGAVGGGADLARAVADADVAITHLQSTPGVTMLGALNGTPVVHLLHNDFEPSRAYLARWPVALAVFNSEWMERAYGHRGPSVVVRPPVLPSEYETHTAGDRVTLINLYHRKGSALFWKLASAMPDVRFLGVTGGYGQQDVRDLPNVEVLPHVPAGEMAGRVYARTAILLMPSIYESWGRTGVEAMCSAIPVIAHPTPGLQESLGYAGRFVDRDDVAGWEYAIRQLQEISVRRQAGLFAARRAAELAELADQDLTRWIISVENLVRR